MVVDPFSDDDEGAGVEGGDEASDEGASGRSPEIAKLRVLEDGTLSTPKAEALALAHADGYAGMEAWRVAGGGSGSNRARIIANPLFWSRVEVLVSEKTKLEDGGVLGEALWIAKQNWRIARAGGVVTEIHRATVLLIETTKAFSGIQAGGDPGASPPSNEGEVSPQPRGPGRPAHQPRQIRVDVEQMRSGLLSKGVRAPAAVS